MKITCNKCGKPVSTEISDNTIITAWVECQKCISDSYSFRVLNISNNLSFYPESRLDTMEFKELIEHVEDEQQLFVYCDESKEFWKAEEFFLQTKIRDFESDSFENE